MRGGLRFLVGFLLALCVLVLLVNLRYLYVAPVANTWLWWIGDETWLMAQYHQFVLTGHYGNPLAPGSAFSRCSGLLFGSCYLTAVLYALPLFLFKGHTIAVGRTVSWVFSIATVTALWMLAKRFSVGPVLRAFGCLLLASTFCFFITSHSARPDMLIGLTILLLVGWLPFFIQKPTYYKSVLIGLLLPLSLLINAHVLILSTLMVVYGTWVAGGFDHRRAFFVWLGGATGGFLIFLIVQYALLGSTSLVGPFSGSSVMLPIMHIIHPKTDLANIQARFSIAKEWAPGVLWTSCVLAASLIVARIHLNIRWSDLELSYRRMLICAALVVLSSIFFEFYWNRYLIYVLPTVVLSLLILLSHIAHRVPRSFFAALAVALSVSLIFALIKYAGDTYRCGVAGGAITAANRAAMEDALATIHAAQTGKLMHTGKVRVYSTVPGECIAMDDSCQLITPVMFVQPDDRAATREQLWTRANIDFAIICRPAHSDVDWNDVDSHIYAEDPSNAKVIFERVGPFSDIGRSYDQSDLKLLDTLCVYQFH